MEPKSRSNIVKMSFFFVMNRAFHVEVKFGLTKGCVTTSVIALSKEHDNYATLLAANVIKLSNPSET